MFKEHLAKMIFPLSGELVKCQRQVAFDPSHPFISETVGHASGTAFVISKLALRTLQVTMMVQPLQASQHLLRAAGGQSRQMIRAQKTMAIDKAKNLPVTLG
jgi:hypothetical protein